jgi:hypothetical protein
MLGELWAGAVVQKASFESTLAEFWAADAVQKATFEYIFE